MGEHGLGRLAGACTVLCCALALTGTGALAAVTISGSVSDASGRPLAGVEVSLAPVMDDFQGYTRRLVPGAIWAAPVEVAVTGDDGRYALAAAAGERWRLIVEHPEHATVTRRLEPIHHDREMEPVTLGPARELEIGIRAADGRPVAGARLMAYSGSVTHDLWPHSWAAGVTDASGVARVKVPEPGPWFAEVVPEELGPADLREHGQPPMKAELPAASPRSLRVLRSSGEPAADAVVFRPGKGVTLTRTDADGRATLHGEPGSRMTVSVLTADGESANPSVSFPEPGASDDPRTVQLRAPHRLTVTVESADGSGPVAGAVAWGIDDHLERADDRGRLVFPLPVIWPDGRLTVAAPGHLPWREEDLSLSSLGDGSLVVPLHPAAGLSGRVVDGVGRPVAGAAVEVRADDTPWISPGSSFAGSGWLAEGRDTLTGPDGGFTADALPAEARLGVVARAPGFAPALLTLPPLAPHEWRSGVELVLSPGLRATGRVVDAAGKPVANAMVEVHRDHPATADSSREPRFLAGTAEADAEGRFELADLSPGPAQLRLAAPGHPGALPAAIDVEIPMEAPMEIQAAPGGAREVDLGDLRLAPGHRIAGRVVDEDGVPVPGQSVEIRGYGDRRPGRGFEIARAATGADGAFVFEDRASGEHELTVSRNKPPSTAAAKVRLWRPDPAEETVVLVLRTGLRLFGRVVDSEGAPIAGAEVESRLRRGLVHSASAATDGAGGYLLTGLEPGEHRLTVEAEGYLSASQRVDLADGTDPVPVDFELLGGTELTGDVRWPDGRPAAGVRVYAQGVDGADWSTPSHTTGPAGLFSVGPVPPGPADLVALKRSIQVRQRIEVGAEPAPGSGPVTLTLPAGGRLSGRVVDAAGEPVAAAQVWLGSRGAGGAWTGDDGRFVLIDVPPGDHRLVVDHPGYVEHRSNRIEVGEAALEDFRIVLRRGAVVTGRVEGVEPGTERRVRVSLDRRGGPESLSVDADSAGRFRIDRVPPGEYDVQARAGVVVATGSFELAPGTESLEIEVMAVTGSDLRGRVVQDGRPVVGVRVAVRHDSRAVEDYTSGEGRFLLRRVPPGARTLEVDDPGGHMHRRELEAVEVSESGELQVELPAGRITGRVTDAATGEPLARATVYLETLSDDAPEGPWRNRIERRIRADSRGVFVVYAVDPGRYRVRSEHEGPGPGLGQSLARREVEVASEPVRGVDLALSPAHRVVLRPTPEPDPADGFGLPYALYDPEGRLELVSAAGADASGRVVLNDLPEGEWTLWIGTFRTILQGIDLRVPSDGEIPVELVEGGSVRFELPEELFNAKPVDLEIVLRDSQGHEPPGPPGETIRPFVIFDGPSHFLAEAGVGHLPPGKWTIELRYIRGMRWRGTFRAFAGQETEVRLVRVPPEAD